MSAEFRRGQVVNARRSSVDKFLRGWYLGRNTHDEHEVYIQDGGRMTVSDDNIQAHEQNIVLKGGAFVFRRPGGTFTVMTFKDDPQFISDTFKEFLNHQLVGIIDFNEIEVKFAEGHGMMPKKLQQQVAP